MKLLLAALLVIAPASAAAAGLTIKPGETWLFAVKGGEPANARKVPFGATPRAGEIKASLRSFLGTNLTISNHGGTGFTYRAELLGPDGKATTARACTLPAGGKPTFEHWKESAAAVRLSGFKSAAKGGSCP